MYGSNRKIIFLLAFIFLVYAAVRAGTNQPARETPRELVDTAAYLRVSQQPIFDIRFWGDKRPFVFPLLLKISGQDFSLASALQLGFSILAWGLLALLVSASMRTVWLKPLSFGLILALSLVRHLASWDYVMMTESLSVSWFVLFIALGIWLSHSWRMDKVIALCFAGVFLAFTRDTNAYLLLMLAGMLVIAFFIRWVRPRVLILTAFFLFIFLLNNYNSEIGGRWIFPLNNIVGRRVLLSSKAVTYLESCGMPVTPALLGMTNEFGLGQDNAFYNNPELEGYRTWLGEHGKSCYMKWLLSDPIRSVGQSLGQFQELVAFEDVSKYFAQDYDPVLPWFIEPFIYPVKFIPLLWIMLTAAALIAIWKRAWTINPLWGIYILLNLPILPHLFITWHGDAMAPERHALSVGLQLALCFWLLIFLLIDQFILQRQSAQMANLKSPNIFQRFILRVAMMRPVTAFFAGKLHRVDNLMLKLTRGKHTISEITGWPVIQLTTSGARTGKSYTLPMVGIFDGEKIALIASSFGRQHNPGWYYNLKAFPECDVQFNGRLGKYIACETHGEEREKYWSMAVLFYQGYELYKIRAAHRQIPVMVLEPVK